MISSVGWYLSTDTDWIYRAIGGSNLNDWRVTLNRGEILGDWSSRREKLFHLSLSYIRIPLKLIDHLIDVLLSVWWLFLLAFLSPIPNITCFWACLLFFRGLPFLLYLALALFWFALPLVCLNFAGILVNKFRLLLYGLWRLLTGFLLNHFGRGTTSLFMLLLLRYLWELFNLGSRWLWFSKLRLFITRRWFRQVLG